MKTMPKAADDIKKKKSPPVRAWLWSAGSEEMGEMCIYLCLFCLFLLIEKVLWPDTDVYLCGVCVNIVV